MFEEEAEEYADEKCGTIETEEKKFCRMDWQKGAEFGYNKAKEEASELLKEAVQLLKNSDELYGYQVRDFQLKCEQFLKE